MVCHHVGDLRGVEAGQHFVQQQQIRAGRQGPGQFQALLLRHVEAARQPLSQLRQTHLRQGLFRHGGGPAQGVAFPAKTGPHHDVFQDGEFVQGADHLVGPGQTPPGHLVGGQAANLFPPEESPGRCWGDRPR